jgi:hypothetical protein
LLVYFLQEPLLDDKAMLGDCIPQDINIEHVTRNVINHMGRDEVVFQHLEDRSSATKLRNVSAILDAFQGKGFVDTRGMSGIVIADYAS